MGDGVKNKASVWLLNWVGQLFEAEKEKRRKEGKLSEM